MIDFSGLAIAGRVATPSDADWDQARAADAILPPDVCARLAEVKRKWDPDCRIVGNHAVSLDPAV
jgi:hypothetical protein